MVKKIKKFLKSLLQVIADFMSDFSYKSSKINITNNASINGNHNFVIQSGGNYGEKSK